MINLIGYLILIGVFLWLVNSVIPMVDWMKTVINVLVAVYVVFLLLNVFGVMHYPILNR